MYGYWAVICQPHFDESKIHLFLFSLSLLLDGFFPSMPRYSIHHHGFLLAVSIVYIHVGDFYRMLECLSWTLIKNKAKYESSPR